MERHSEIRARYFVQLNLDSLRCRMNYFFPLCNIVWVDFLTFSGRILMKLDKLFWLHFCFCSQRFFFCFFFRTKFTSNIKFWKTDPLNVEAFHTYTLTNNFYFLQSWKHKNEWPSDKARIFFYEWFHATLGSLKGLDGKINFCKWNTFLRIWVRLSKKKVGWVDQTIIIKEK